MAQLQAGGWVRHAQNGTDLEFAPTTRRPNIEKTDDTRTPFTLMRSTLSERIPSSRDSIPPKLAKYFEEPLRHGRSNVHSYRIPED